MKEEEEEEGKAGGGGEQGRSRWTVSRRKKGIAEVGANKGRDGMVEGGDRVRARIIKRREKQGPSTCGYLRARAGGIGVCS